MRFFRLAIPSQFVALCISASLVGANYGPAMAQSAANLAPSTFQPQNQRATTGPVTVARDPGAQTPPGSDRLFVTIGKVEIQGALPQMAGANQNFINTLAGKRVPVSEIFRATRLLESEYADAGYVLARVVLPQQTVRDGGMLRIVVVDGYIEKIDATAVPEPVRNRIVRLTDPLVGKRGIRLQQIERALLLAGDTYGVRLSSTLSAGQQDGGTLLTLDGEYQRVTGSYGFDNSLSDELGPLNLSAGVELNGALQMGETFYARLGGSPTRYFSDSAQYRILAAGVVFPIGLDGLTFNIEGTSSRSTPDNELIPTNSSFDRLSFRFYYPWIRSRRFNLSSQFILDRISDEQNLIGFNTEFPIYDDELSVLRASLDGSWNYDDGSYLQASAVLSQGIDAFGARTTPGPGETPLSRQGADAVFTKLVLGFQYLRPFDKDWSLSLRGRAQSNFGDPLVSSEQISLGGLGELSTFDAGTIQGDDGWVLRAEVARQLSLSIGGYPFIGKPYLFGATGVVGLENPTVFEQSTTKASSYGLGIEFLTIENSPFQSGSLRVEYGRGLRDDLEPDENRFSIVASRRF